MNSLGTLYKYKYFPFFQNICRTKIYSMYINGERIIVKEYKIMFRERANASLFYMCKLFRIF